jgi:hypothetical protein
MFEKKVMKNKSVCDSANAIKNFPAMQNRKGQVTIFIIIGVIIVAASILIYQFYPGLKSTLGIEESTPQTYIQSCVEDKLKETVDLVSTLGGSVAPELYSRYQGINIEYLCYTTEYYVPCTIQQPMLVQHIELEIRNEIDETVNECFDLLEESYVGKGYNVELKTGIKKVQLLPERITSTFNYTFTITKGEDIQKYDSFVVTLDNNNLYELAIITNSILDWESTYGDANPELYMLYYPNLKVERILRDSGDKIYILTDREVENKFQFAVRSQVWPGGFVNSTE